MQLIKHLAFLATAFYLTTAAPLQVDNLDSTLVSPLTKMTSDSPLRCGYVRLHEDDGYIVGVYSRDTCEPIWEDEQATFYRIDTSGCSCKFYTSEESCENADPVQSFSGPSKFESRFTDDEKPTYVFCSENAA